MTKQDYLEFLGYSTEYTVKSSEEIQDYLTLERFRNNIFPVADPTGLKEFGKGAKIVNIKWFEEMTELHFTKKPETVVPPVPKTTEVPKTVVPPAPKVIEKIEKETVEVPYSILLKERIEKLTSKGWLRYNSLNAMSSPEGSGIDDITFDAIEALEENAFVKLLNPTIEKNNEGTFNITKEERIKTLARLEMRLYGSQYVTQDALFKITTLEVETKNDEWFTTETEKVETFYDTRYHERVEQLNNLGLVLNEEDDTFWNSNRLIGISEIKIKIVNDKEFEKSFVAMKEYMESEEYKSKVKALKKPEVDQAKTVETEKTVNEEPTIDKAKSTKDFVDDAGEQLEAKRRKVKTPLETKVSAPAEHIDMFSEIIKIGNALTALQKISVVLNTDDFDDSTKVAKINRLIKKI